MPGVKGRSGRKPLRYERSVVDIVNHSNHVVYCYLNDESQPIKDRAEVASRFSLKHMPERIETSLKVLSLSDSIIQRLLDAMNRLDIPISNHTNNLEHVQEVKAITSDNVATSDNKTQSGGGTPGVSSS